LATVHARDNQPTNQRRHDTAYLNKRLFYLSKVRRLKMNNAINILCKVETDIDKGART